MTSAYGQIQVVDGLEFADFSPSFPAERHLAIKRVQHDSFEQVSERHVLVFRERLAHLQHAALHAHASLNASNLALLC
jgi:hypothetical protein